MSHHPTPPSEPAYAFRTRLAGPHHPDRRDPAAVLRAGEVEIDSDWVISVAADAAPALHRVADDLMDYFSVSLGIDLGRATPPDQPQPTSSPAKTIMITSFAQTSAGSSTRTPVDEPSGSHSIRVDQERIVLSGVDARGVARAGHLLEKLLDLRGGPFLAVRSWSRSPRFRTRMTHSGWGLDDFPDGHLRQIAHAGFTAIVLFATGPDHTPDGSTHRHPEVHSPGRHQDFSLIVERCAEVGLDVYLYAYFHGEDPVHPDDPGAEDFFARTYGALFERCPGAKGLILVGESVEFRSRDPKTSGRLRLDPVPGGAPSSKPNPGWWPCTDFPRWVSRVRDACRRHSPAAEIIFWTYNWGWAPRDERIALIDSLPADVTLQATFEMFEPIEHDGVTNVCVDYTAASVGPGGYFASEATAAHARGLPLYAMANTGGLTWDFGVIGYQPIPFRWAERHAALLDAAHDWGLSGLMENHHYGWYPSIVSELADWSYWTGGLSPDDAITAIARRDFGSGAADAIAAWRLWSDATADYVPTNADQYGPFRIGPSYPITLFTRPQPAVADEAMFGDLIVSWDYLPDLTNTVPTSAPGARLVGEIAALERMLAMWQGGTARLRLASALAPGPRRAEAARMVVLGEFIGCCLTTALNVKRWWRLRTELLITDQRDRAGALLDQLAEIGSDEHANAERAIPLVEADSRLGWEPSMGYLGDAAHLRWKLAHLEHALDHELPAFRMSLGI